MIRTLTVLLIVSLLLAASNIQADSLQTYDQTVTSGYDYGTVSLPAFDPALGTLQSVEL